MRSYIFQMFQSATCSILGGTLKRRKTQEEVLHRAFSVLTGEYLKARHDRGQGLVSTVKTKGLVPRKVAYRACLVFLKRELVRKGALLIFEALKKCPAGVEPQKRPLKAEV